MLYNFSQEGRTIFAPSLNYVVAEVQVMDPESEFDLLKKEILSKESSIIDDNKFVSDWGTRMGKNSLTSRANDYNLLDFKNTKNLRESIKNFHELYLKIFQQELGTDKYYVQCWANVMREKEKIFPHRHSGDGYSYLSGNLCMEVADTSTYYIHPFTDEPWESKNENGKMTMFPSFVKHYTDPVPAGQTRVTIAFDILTEEAYNVFSETYPNSTLVELH
tara:strand:- start:113 stop:769 length:657 start_codon:yes stop_codon:yes gene_type:complete